MDDRFKKVYDLMTAFATLKKLDDCDDKYTYSTTSKYYDIIFLKESFFHSVLYFMINFNYKTGEIYLYLNNYSSICSNTIEEFLFEVDEIVSLANTMNINMHNEKLRALGEYKVFTFSDVELFSEFFNQVQKHFKVYTKSICY